MKKDEISRHIGFAGSYQNMQQKEIQNAYFGHNTFSIFTACCYVRNTKLKTVDKRSVIIITKKSGSLSYSDAFIDFENSEGDQANLPSSSSRHHHSFVEQWLRLSIKIAACISPHNLFSWRYSKL